jgi:hypothetical protein
MLCSDNIRKYMQRCGYLKYSNGIKSDHRAIFLDLSSNLFKNNLEYKKLQTMQIGTNSTNVESKKYIEFFHYQLVQHKVYDKLQKLINELEESDAKQFWQFRKTCY